MNIHESRNNYYHIDTSKKPVEVDSEQETVEEWIAKGNKPLVVPIGVGSYLTDMQKANKQKNSKEYGKNYK